MRRLTKQKFVSPSLKPTCRFQTLAFLPPFAQQIGLCNLKEIRYLNRDFLIYFDNVSL
jgi:hypothetical protein